MSFIPSQNLHGRHMIAQFVLEKRAKGTVLPYSEYQYIDAWLKLGAEDDLLLILDDILPRLYANSKARAYPASLSKIDRQVQAKLKANMQRNNF